jgi:hypothetical protein
MKKTEEKRAGKKNKHCSQLELFNSQENNCESIGFANKEHISKIFSLPDYTRQKEIEKFYDIANKLTSHLK